MIGLLAIELAWLSERLKSAIGVPMLFHYPRAATKPHCGGRYLGPMNYSVDPS